MNTPQQQNWPAPDQPAPKKKWWSWPSALIGGLVGVVVGAVGITAFVLGVGGLVFNEDAPVTDEQIQACHDAVTERAKHPGGVEFVDTFLSMSHDGLDMLVGRADFPNGFNAPVRQYFECRINEDGSVTNFPFVGEYEGQATSGEKVWPK